MSGKGRGRGWLKLDKQDKPIGLVTANETTSNKTAMSQYQDATQFDSVISFINQFNESDDGIKINQKVRHLCELAEEACQDEEEVAEMMKIIYTKALDDQVFQAKFFLFISLNSFRDIVVKETNLRQLLFNNMQETFNDAATLQVSNKHKFHNAIRLLSEFFNKVQVNNQPYRVFATPLLTYCEMLLDTAQPDDVEVFATELYKNAAYIKAIINGSITELMVKVRNVLLRNNELSEESKVWLLMSIDFANNNFRMLPPELMNFYQEKLAVKSTINIQKSLNLLSIQTAANSTLEKYNSDVNVLQINSTQQAQHETPTNNARQSPSPPQQQKQKPQMKPNSQQNQPHSQNQPHTQNQSHSQNQTHPQNSTHPHANQKLSQQQPRTKPNPQKKSPREESNNEMYSTWNMNDYNNSRKQPEAHSHPAHKTGRPILGAGARNSSKQDDMCKENSSGWNAKHKNTEGSGWGGDKHSDRDGHREPRSNKGWEHDDRFETDYN